MTFPVDPRPLFQHFEKTKLPSPCEVSDYRRPSIKLLLSRASAPFRLYRWTDPPKALAPFLPCPPISDDPHPFSCESFLPREFPNPPHVFHVQRVSFPLLRGQIQPGLHNFLSCFFPTFRTIVFFLGWPVRFCSIHTAPLAPIGSLSRC